MRQAPRRLGLLTGVAVILVGIVAFAVSREVATTAAPRPAPQSESRDAPAPRPALTPAEHSYIEAVWPIHSRVERSVVRVALGAAFFRLQDIDRDELRSRLEQASATYSDAEEQLRLLEPPPRLQGAHAGYLGAVRLFGSSALEMLRMYDDGDEGHLAAGFPVAQHASDRIREVASQLFPDQYPPN